MTEAKLGVEDNPNDSRLYSLIGISAATFLGGPLAAGYLISANFKAMDKPTEGRNALIIGIVSTVVLLVVLEFFIPEGILDNLKYSFPAMLALLAWQIAKERQGDVLKAYKENNNAFFSIWRALGIGLIFAIIIFIGIWGYNTLFPGELYKKYTAEIAQFSKNEEQTLAFYENLDGTESNDFVLKELDENTIPKWKENVEIINRISQLEGLTPEIIEQNKIFLEYAKLRLEAFELLKKGIKEDTNQYDQQWDQINAQIDKVLKKVN